MEYLYRNKVERKYCPLFVFNFTMPFSFYIDSKMFAILEFLNVRKYVILACNQYFFAIESFSKLITLQLFSSVNF